MDNNLTPKLPINKKDNNPMKKALEKSMAEDFDTDQDWINEVVYKTAVYSGIVDPLEVYDEDVTIADLIRNKEEKAEESYKNEFIPDEVQRQG